MYSGHGLWFPYRIFEMEIPNESEMGSIYTIEAKAKHDFLYMLFVTTAAVAAAKSLALTHSVVRT